MTSDDVWVLVDGEWFYRRARPPADSRCHRCDGRGCEACDYRILVMLDLADE